MVKSKGILFLGETQMPKSRKKTEIGGGLEMVYAEVELNGYVHFQMIMGLLMP